MVSDVLAVTVLVLAVSTVFQRRPLRGVLMRMGLSVLAVALYSALAAPDVALAEAMVGALLSTFVYVLLLRTPGTLRVGYVPIRMLFEEYPGGFDGLEYKIVRSFASSHGYRLEFTRAEDVRELKVLLDEGLIDIACGPILGENGIIETVIFELSDGSRVDMLSAEGLDPSTVVGKKRAEYVILSSVEEFSAFLDELKKTGKLDSIVEKYAGGRS